MVPMTFAEELKWAEMVSSSNLCPPAYRGKPADIVVAKQMGMELGFTPHQSLLSVCIVNGKASLPVETMLSLCLKSGLLEDIREWSDAERLTCYCEVKRKGMSAATFSFSKRDAEQAKLWGKAGPWVTYPERMLLNRARGFALRDRFPDVLKGFISVEEARDWPLRTDIKDVSPPEKLIQHQPSSSLSEDVLSWCTDGTVDDVGLDFIKDALKIHNIYDVVLIQFAPRIPKLHKWIVDKYLKDKS